MKRLITGAVFFSVLMQATALWAGGKQEGQAPPEVKYTISWAQPVEGPMDQNTQAQRYLEKRFPDIKLKLIPLQRSGSSGESWEDALNVMIAGGDSPDVMWRIDNFDFRNYARQGLITPVPYDLIRRNAPKTFADINDYGIDVWLASNVDGVNYGIPTAGRFNSYPITDAWRGDWLSKLGLAVPTTIDEMTKAFQEMTFDDPNGDGKDDTYGTSGRGRDSMELMWPNLWGAYGVMPVAWMKQPDGTVRYGVTTDNMRNALRKAAEWYKMGVIDPEFLTTDWALLKEKWFNGKIGYISQGTWYRLYPGAELYVGLKDVNPSAQITLAPPVKGPDGTYGYFGWGKATGGIAFGKQLASNQPKLARIIRLYEAVNTDPAVYQNTHWGIEGKQWKRDSSGAAVFIKPYDNMQNRGEFGFNFFPSGDQSMMNRYLRYDIDSLTKYAKMGNFRPEVQYTWLPNNLLSQEANREIQNATLTWEQWWVKFITGNASLDTDWNQYLKEIGKAGLTAATREANIAWKNVAGVLANIKAQVEPGN